MNQQFQQKQEETGRTREKDLFQCRQRLVDDKQTISLKIEQFTQALTLQMIRLKQHLLQSLDQIISRLQTSQAPLDYCRQFSLCELQRLLNDLKEQYVLTISKVISDNRIHGKIEAVQQKSLLNSPRSLGLNKPTKQQIPKLNFNFNPSFLQFQIIKKKAQFLCICEMGQKQVAVGMDDCTIKLIEVVGLTTIQQFKGNSYPAQRLLKKCFKFSVKLIACCEKSILIWDVNSNTLQRRIDAHNEKISCVEDLQKQRWLISGSVDGAIMLNSIQGIQSIQHTQSPDKSVLLFCKTRLNRLVSVGQQNFLIVWEILTKNRCDLQKLKVISTQSQLTSLCSLLDQNLIAAGLADGQVDIINIKTSQIVKKIFMGHCQIIQLLLNRPLQSKELVVVCLPRQTRKPIFKQRGARMLRWGEMVSWVRGGGLMRCESSVQLKIASL